MKSMHFLLDEAEKEWRPEVKRDFPLWGSIPVSRKTSSDEDWQFYTDFNKIYANINNDAGLQEGFENIISESWDGKPEDLARETMHYALFHELYHLLEAPFSRFGEDNDTKRIRQAMRKGLLAAEPDLSALEQVIRVDESENLVEDFILDNRFAIDNKVKGYVRQDIIPAFHFLALQESSEETTDIYKITRFLYGVLYGPQNTHGFFERKATKEGVDVAEEALSALINRPVRLPRRNDSLADGNKSMSPTDPEPYERLQEYVTDIREVFSGDDRYKGIERFMAVLGRYVKKGMPRERPVDEENPAKNPQSVLQDLLDDMSFEEQKQFVDELSQESDDALGLDAFAMHEFYKRNHPTVRVYSGNKADESRATGLQERLYLKKSQIITEDQIGGLNLKRIEYFERRGLPGLIKLENGTYRLNEYGLKPRDLRETKQRDLKDAERRSLSDILYADSRIGFHVPDVVEVYVSVGDGVLPYHDKNFRVDDGGCWDIALHVLYGFVDAIREAGEKAGKKTDIYINKFVGRNQSDSEVVSVDQFWEGDYSVIETLFKTEYEAKGESICSYLDGKKRTYVLITDLQDVSGFFLSFNNSDEFLEYDRDMCAREGEDFDPNRILPRELQLLEISKSPGNKILALGTSRACDPWDPDIVENPNVTYQYFTDNLEDKYRMMKEGVEMTL